MLSTLRNTPSLAIFSSARWIVTIAKMANYDPLRRHAFFAQQCDLFHGEFTEVGSMGHDACAGTTLRPRRRAEHPFLSGSDVLPLCTDFPDDAGANICAIGALDNFIHYQIGQRISIPFPHDRRIERTHDTIPNP